MGIFDRVGHELRTPLTSVRGYLETVIDGKLDRVTATKFLRIALGEAERMGRLVDGLFDLSLLDLRGDHGGNDSCVVDEAVSTAIAATKPLADLRNANVFFAPRPGDRVAIGSDRFAHILVNLLDNAIKHGRENGRIELSSARLDDRFVEIYVDDDGPGVGEHEREKIFEFNRRGERASARGGGIGLSIVRLMAERIGGEVDCTGSPLGGARFRARLPLAVRVYAAREVTAFSALSR